MIWGPGQSWSPVSPPAACNEKEPVNQPKISESTYPSSYSVGPRLLMIVCWICATLVIAGLLALIWSAPGTQPGQGFPGLDVGGWVLVALFLLTVLWRFGQVKIFVSPQGVRVRNFFRSYQYTWAQILRVSLTTSDNWVHLDLSDGTQCLVLALATSEGKRTLNCVADLRARVIEYGEAATPQDPADPV